MAETKKTKAEVEKEIRQAGITRLDTTDMVQVGGGTFYLEHESGRFIEFKVVVKSDKFDMNELEALLEERRIIEEGKAERAALAAKKKAKDAEKRAKVSQKEKAE